MAVKYLIVEILSNDEEPMNCYFHVADVIYEGISTIEEANKIRECYLANQEEDGFPCDPQNVQILQYNDIAFK